MNITNSVVLLTGANRGLGRALLDALLDRGAQRVYAVARDPLTVTGLDERVVPIRLNLTAAGDIAGAPVQAPDVDLLVNNAGTSRFAGPLAADRESLAEEIATNYLGTVDLIRAFTPVIDSVGGGAIVNVLSLLALASSPSMAGYSASKAALHSYTQAIRPELRRRGIAVHGVYPGGIDTDMLAGYDVPKAVPRMVAEEILDGIIADHDDIFPDPTAREMSMVWRTDPKSFELAFSGEAQ
ncbi:SDR family oxidoreductase [Nocardia sp. CNY236]|uniref:SDR family oxidoreductase n=1 Tax=Nocardia sp. CNY236 TaxID=1169152 RepID=UPI00040A0749|nr:SDR family oxidoreductase [Nocardia sp. CNY236]